MNAQDILNEIHACLDQHGTALQLPLPPQELLEYDAKNSAFVFSKAGSALFRHLHSPAAKERIILQACYVRFTTKLGSLTIERRIHLYWYIAFRRI